MSHEKQLKVSAPSGAPLGPSDEDLQVQINLRLRLDEIAAVEAHKLRSTAPPPPTERQLGQLACRIYDARRARDRVFQREIFGEPAWDMLLALYCLPRRGELLTVTSLSIAAGVPQTTGLRWQATLTGEGLIERGPKGVDARKQFIRLTPPGRTLMESYLTRLFYCDAPMPRMIQDGN